MSKKFENLLMDTPDYEDYTVNEVKISEVEKKELALLKGAKCCDSTNGFSCCNKKNNINFKNVNSCCKKNHQPTCNSKKKCCNK